MTFSQDSSKRFILPPRGTLKPGGPGDPLEYYYRPIVGRLYRARVEQALSLLEPPYERALEVGYGGGLLMPSLGRLAKELHGADLDATPERVAHDLEQFEVHPTLLRKDVAQVEYPGEHFDLVVAISVFEHISDPRPALTRIYEILKPGGHFLVGIPRVDPLMILLFRLIGYHAIEEHHRTTPNTFEESARKRFELVAARRLPERLPSAAALYHNMLFRKPTE